jgi:DNA-binding transcriptional MerR regulator
VGALSVGRVAATGGVIADTIRDSERLDLLPPPATTAAGCRHVLETLAGHREESR